MAARSGVRCAVRAWLPGGVRRSRAAGRRTGRDHGMATAELAVALPALLLVVVAAVGAVSAVTAQLRCADAAVRAARAAARGAPTGSALSAAPGAAHLAISRDGDEIRATVTARWQPVGHLGVDLAATAAAEVEPGEVTP
jgi:Flp pilus assembly protein TadG